MNGTLFWLPFIQFRRNPYADLSRNMLDKENMEYWAKLEKEDLDKDRMGKDSFEYQVEGDG